MSLLPVVQSCDNARLPSPPFGPAQHLAGLARKLPPGHEFLSPFYIYAPDYFQGSTVVRPPPPPRRPSTRRTSSNNSSIHKSLSPKPLSRYLTRPTSSDQLSTVFALQEEALNLPYSEQDKLRDFSQPIGFLRPCVLMALLRDNEKMVEMHSKPCWKLLYTNDDDPSSAVISEGDEDAQAGPWCVAFEDWINESEDRQAVRHEHLDRLIRGWKATGMFSDQLAGWRDEDYLIYGPKSSTDRQGPSRLPGWNVACRIERAAVGLFGFLSFGAHLTAYVKKDGEYLFWVPRRSATKATWPGKLDNTVAGGIAAGESPEETIVRECMEEASLPEDFVRSRLRATGLISYTHRDQHGWVQPEIQYTYDLELPADDSVLPRPNDGEAEDFQLMALPQLTEALLQHAFKPNSAGVLVDFLVRHGLICAENDENFVELCTALKQAPGLPVP